MSNNGLLPSIAWLGSFCCGCAACESACPTGSVVMKHDEEGFLRPMIGLKTCIGCGRCERICPALLEASPYEPADVSCYAAKSRDDELRNVSSSGGIFTELCRSVIEDGGVVYGVVMERDMRGCSFAAAETMSELSPMRGSKYMQADARGVYRCVRDWLRSGRKVLFCGTPCQVNALCLFLGEDYPNLLLVDFICHGVPSPKLWAANVDLIEKMAHGTLSSVSFRSKQVGRQNIGKAHGSTRQTLFEPSDRSPYMRLFLRDVCLRPSCYVCPAKTTRMADVTLGDFWGVDRVVNVGVSPGTAPL